MRMGAGFATRQSFVFMVFGNNYTPSGTNKKLDEYERGNARTKIQILLTYSFYLYICIYRTVYI